MTEQNNIQLPKNWKIELLGKIAKAEKGLKPKTLSEEKSKNSLPYIDIRAFEKGEIRFYTDGVKCRICEKNDILLVWDGARSGLCGKAIKGAIGSTLAKVSSIFLTNEFLFYFLTANYNKLNTNTKGIGIPHIDPNYLWNLKIAVPPLPEQHRIVAKIEELFSEIDKAVENLQTARQQIKTYRQSVLKHAFEGKLTTAWRESLKFKAESLKLAAEPKSIYQTKNGLPEGWEWKKLEMLTTVLGGIAKNSSRKNTDFELPFLRVANVYSNKLELSEIHTTGVYKNEIEKALLKKNDLLIIEGNGSKSQIGRVAIWDGSINPCVHQNHVIKCRGNGLTNPKYLLYFLISSQGRRFIETVSASTSGLYTLSISKVKSIPIVFTNLEEQHQIVAEIEKRFSEADKLEESIETALRQTEALRQSILKKAFAGKLVEPDENKAGE